MCVSLAVSRLSWAFIGAQSIAKTRPYHNANGSSAGKRLGK